MKLNHTGVFIAILILILMLLICHTMNTLYPRNTNTSKNTNTNTNTSKNTSKNNKIINMFNNIKQKTIPTQYNIITYDKQITKVPCGNQAQIPCKITQSQCTTNTNTKLNTMNPNELSDSELALLYKSAYEMAGNEVLLRTLNTSKP